MDGHKNPDYKSIGDGPRQVVRSPEQVVLHFPVAGPTSRMLAYGIDLIGIYLLEGFVLLVLFLASPLAAWLIHQFHTVAVEAKKTPQSASESAAVLYLLAVFLLIQIVIEWGYFVIWELSSGGRSLGKIALNLRVVCDGCGPITLRESLVRNLLRVVDILPANYLVGLIAMVVSAEGKRLGDVAAGTVVVRMDRPAPALPPLLDEVDAAASAFRFDRSQVALLGRAERALLRQTLRRMETLPPETAEAALARAVEVLCARIGYGPVEPSERVHFLRAMLRATRGR